MAPKIHVAYGFHVNCYHSYRGDTNDNLGFGSDIRIIRKIIDVLNRLNEQGIPVKGTWDIENFFSLEQILPQYAPDIIDGIRRRVELYGDENIIMGYSNGALGAMTEDELRASVEWAITNPQGSGLQDLFGSCERIVRPQEVMFTPSQVHTYRQLGVQALCLYYSCVPFDAFRTLIPRLPDVLAFNPLTYTYDGDSITVLPTYNNSDVCDAGCLRAWVRDLHQKQKCGEIKQDLFLFINMDADAIFWETMDLPVVGHRIANTDGIHGLVCEISDLPYIVFDTPGGYLKSHAPLGEIHFTQDTADGNFTGYASWSEKPYNRKIWTALERARAMGRVNSSRDWDSPSFRDRVLLLSTTHFGLATPVLNIQREKKADELALRVIEQERSALPKVDHLTVYNTAGSDFQCVQLSTHDPRITCAAQIQVTADGLLDYAVVPMDSDCRSVALLMRFAQVRKRYELTINVSDIIPPMPSGTPQLLSSGAMTLQFGQDGRIVTATRENCEIGNTHFWESYIRYGGRRYNFQYSRAVPLQCGGSGEGIRVTGEIHLPGELSGGHFTYDFFRMASSSGIFIRTEVHYPHTPEADSISTENSSLGRFSDMSWQEVVPFQITPTLRGDLSVVKRNFEGDISSFRTQTFPESDPKNRTLASFNHHLTGGFVALTNGEHGLALANARQVLNSMAHCPMRLDGGGTVHLNPFGTYYGPQRHHWGRARDQILDTYTLVTPQGKSIAPAYNGNSETALLELLGFDGSQPNQKLLQELNGLADGAVANAPTDSLLLPFYGDNVLLHDTKAEEVDVHKLRNPILTGLSGNLGKYVTRGVRAIGHIITAQIRAGEKLKTL